MKLCFNDLLYAFSYGLDCVEDELVGVSDHHCKRIAYLTARMGKAAGISEEELLDLVACAILHDNALAEYIENEYNKKLINGERGEIEVGRHCLFGERNLRALAFVTNVNGAILYHHECADGSGPFGKKTKDTPFAARLIHLADQLDATFDLSEVDEKKKQQILTYLDEKTDILFDTFSVSLLKQSMDDAMLQNLKTDQVLAVLKEIIPNQIRDYSSEEVMAMASFFAAIIDYKSRFTKMHSMGIATKCKKMAVFYNYDEEKQAKLYFAGAVHDIGKLVVDSRILEKPGKLTRDEYNDIKNHADYTYELLSPIHGLEEITLWASNHHEKLNGTGYPNGKSAVDLSKEERLLACLDIYQALTEKRPYKDGMSHGQAIAILNDMCVNGELDSQITQDIDYVFQQNR